MREVSDFIVTQFSENDIGAMMEIWNEVVRDGNAFPQDELLTMTSAKEFFSTQTYSAVIKDKSTKDVLGLYILHPNGGGHRAHISNASFAVKKSAQGKGLGRALVSDCLKVGKSLGFLILIFNAVVATNTAARALYESLGFNLLGTLPGGFKKNDGALLDTCIYYIAL